MKVGRQGGGTNVVTYGQLVLVDCYFLDKISTLQTNCGGKVESGRRKNDNELSGLFVWGHVYIYTHCVPCSSDIRCWIITSVSPSRNAYLKEYCL